MIELFKRYSISELEKNFEMMNFNERVSTFMNNVNQEIEYYYKNFLFLRYGFVPKAEELVDFYKKYKIRPTWYDRLTERTFVVREKGHKVFVLKMWDKVDKGRIDTFFKFEKVVFHRKRRK